MNTGPNPTKGPRIATRNANGFFDPAQGEAAPEPKYIKNPETGIYERNYKASVDQRRPIERRRDDARADESTSSRRERPSQSSRIVRSPGRNSPESSVVSSPQSRRPHSPNLSERRPSFTKPLIPMFDDMMKGLDELKGEEGRRPSRFESRRQQSSGTRRKASPSESRQNTSLNYTEDNYSGTSLDDIRNRKSSEPETSRRSPDVERSKRPSDSEKERQTRRNLEDRGRRPTLEDREMRLPEQRERRPTLEERERRLPEQRERRPTLEERERRIIPDERERRPSRPTTANSPPSRRARSGSRKRDSPKEEVFEVPDEEQREFEKQKRELQKLKDAQKAADKREAEKVAREREKRTLQDSAKRGSASSEFSLISSSAVKESLLVPDYLNALMTTLRQDDTISPVPEDFTDRAAYAAWRRDMRRSFQEVLIKMIKYRFLLPPEPAKPSFEPIQFRLRVIEAKGLIQKEGRTRDTFCKIEYGDFSSQSKSKTKRDKYETEVVLGTTDPKWDQTLPIEVTDLAQSILIQVFDKAKDHFLGQVLLSMSDLISKCQKSYDGIISEWLDLKPREGKYKDKYVGGKISIGGKMNLEEKKGSGKTYQEIQNTLSRMQVDNRALFDVLLRACLVLDLFTPREGRVEVLSPEAVNMVKAWAITWQISKGYQVIGYLKIVFEKYTIDAISISDLLKSFHFLYGIVRGNNQLSSAEMDMAIDLLEKMKDHCSNRVIKYKELYPKNRPNGVLESTILVLRMVHRFPTYKDKHPELQDSYRDELKIMMTESCIVRFQRFKEQSTPMDEGDVESVIEGINKLADLINMEIELDVKYFQPAFAQELDIVRLTAETLLKYFTLVLEDGGDILAGDAAVNSASHHVFQLYKTLRLMAERYAQSVAGLTAMSTSYIEGWFAPFMYKWLAQLSERTIDWVYQAIKADTFIPEGTSDGSVPLHSSSITDVFSAIYTELEFITDLQWSDPVQNAQFLQAFAKTVNRAIEQYCDAITNLEKKATTATSAVSDFTKNLLGRSDNEPKDIQAESCAKLRNISFSMTKLREMYRMMDVQSITKNLKQHKQQANKIVKTPSISDDFLTGAFNIQVAYAENIKPTLKNGASNPYVVIKVPEGTVVPPPAQPTSRKKISPTSADELPAALPAPIILSGSSCELFKSRVINETLNPTWDESHSVLLPPIESLEVIILSKNLLTSDDIAGSATIDLSVGTRLRRKLIDLQTHDVFVELEPQGRMLLRLKLEGEEEDVDFWFRRTNERLIRTRDSFLRSLTAKITPYVKEIISKAIKENEAAPLPSTSYFSSLISAVEYSDLTPSGKSINEPVREEDAEIALGPLNDYLDKNLETLCCQLPPAMAQAVIEKTWNETLIIFTNMLIPPLFGLHSQKHLNRRQSSMAEMCLLILRDFMNGDGGEFGLPYSTLDNQKYQDLCELFKLYHIGIPKIRREYELSLLGGKDKELLLRLVRLTANLEEDKNWIEIQLEKRRDQSRK